MPGQANIKFIIFKFLFYGVLENSHRITEILWSMVSFGITFKIMPNKFLITRQQSILSAPSASPEKLLK